MTVPGTWRGIVGRYNSCSKEVRDYFNHFPSLAENYPWDVSISYLFGLVELAHNMTLYCGVVKLHRVNATMAKTAVNNQHLTREGFKELYKSVFGKTLKTSVSKKIEEAEKIRDKILHGKRVSEADKRKAVCDVLDYAEAFNEELNDVAKFKPFGSLKGFKGRATSLDKSTSRWVLKGIGFESFQ